MPNYFNDPKLQDYARQMEVKYELPSGILDTLIRAESGGNYGAMSNKGATGLTQLMPGTAKEMGVKNISDPYQNIEGGAKYFGQQFKTFGDPVLAAAAYNGGPGVRGLRERDVNKLPQETYDYMEKFVGYRNQPTSQPEIQLTSSDQSKPNIISDTDLQKLKNTNPSPNVISDTDLQKLKVQNRTWGDVPGEAVGNIIPSAINLTKNTLSGIAQAALHPIDTGKGILNLAQGAIERNTPMSQEEFNQITARPETYKAMQERSQMAKDFGETLANRYGSEEALKNTLATDPVGALSDISGTYGIGKFGVRKAVPVVEPIFTKAIEKGLQTKYLEDIRRYISKSPIFSRNIPEIPTSKISTAEIPTPEIHSIQIPYPSYIEQKAAESSKEITGLPEKLFGKISAIAEHPVGQLVQSPILYPTKQLFSNAVGPLARTILGRLNRADITKEQINALYDIGRYGTNTPISVGDFGWFPKGGLSAEQALTGLGLFSSGNWPAIAVLSPKIVAGASKSMGTAVKNIEALSTKYQNIPFKGLLGDLYNDEQQQQY